MAAVAANLKQNIRNEPFKVRVPTDPPPIVNNPKRQQTVEVKITGPAVTVPAKQVWEAVKAANGLADATNMRIKVIQVAIYGPYLVGGRTTITDALSGITVSDQGTPSRRAVAALRYPLNVSPTIDTSSTPVNAVLVNGTIEGASETSYGLCRINLQWRTY